MTVHAPVKNADMLYSLYENVDKDPRVKFKFWDDMECMDSVLDMDRRIWETIFSPTARAGICHLIAITFLSW